MRWWILWLAVLPALCQDAPPPRVRESESVSQTRLLHRVAPVYPSRARSAHIQGTVRLEITIARDGAVRSARVLSGHPLLIPAALRAVRQWVYRPALVHDVSAEVITEASVNFSLDPAVVTPNGEYH